MCGVLFNQFVNLTQNLISPPAGNDNPQQIAGTDVFQFSASSSASTTSRYTMDATVKNNALNFTDHFSTTVWIKSVSNGQINQYVFSFDNSANDRVYTWRLRATRLTIFYRRARLNDIPPAQSDSGENSRVGLSFYFKNEVIPGGSIFDGQWHFYKLDVDYPLIKLYVDGYFHNATEGHYFSVTGQRVTLPYGDSHKMPAKIIEKDATYKSQVTGRIGGTQRYSGQYNFNGFLRLLSISSTMNNEQYTCIASCNTSLVPAGYTPDSEDFDTTVDSFSVFYQPVSRTLYFYDTNANSSVYTTFLKSISYNTNGFLPAQTIANMGEGRRLELKVTKCRELFL